jgi:AbiV family abortive infection protein
MVMSKRKYRDSLRFVCDAIWACSANAMRLATGATVMLGGGNHALALSVAILALEELSKATLIDGLLFAKASDSKARTFERGHRQHTDKLARVTALHLFPLKVAVVHVKGDDACFIGELRDHEQRCKDSVQRLAAVLSNDEQFRKDGFAVLNTWKQKGFYVNASTGGRLEDPSVVVTRELAEFAVTLAANLAGFFDLVLRDSYADYLGMAARVRSGMSEMDHEALEEIAVSLVESRIAAAPNKELN